MEHGGSIRAGRRKLARPFDPGRSMHIVMRSRKAKGCWSFLSERHRGRIHGHLLSTIRRYDGRLYGYENVGNHLHLSVKFSRRRDLQTFLRVFAQGVMFMVTGARKGNPRGPFFDAIAYSRVVCWGREFKTLKAYFWKNALEALGWGADAIRAARKSAKEVPL